MENSDLPLAEVTSISRSVQCATGITYANPESEIVSIDYLQTCLFEPQFLNWIQLKDVKLFLKSSYFDKNYEFDGVIETVSINMQRKIISLELFRDRLDMASNVQPFSFNVHDIISLQIFY